MLDTEKSAITLEAGSYLPEAGVNVAALQAGDEVQLQISGNSLLAVTLLFYMLPLGFLIAGLGLGLQFSMSESGQAVMSFAGLAVGVIVARKLLAQFQNTKIVGITRTAPTVKP